MISLSAIISSPARADEWGDQDANTGPHPDEDPHTTCFGNSFPIVGARDVWVRDIEVNAIDVPTDVNINHKVLDCVTSGAGETDVLWKGGNVTTGVLGQAPCNDDESASDQCTSST